MPSLARELHDDVARDALEHAVARRRRHEHAVAHAEDVLARALGDVAVLGEHHGLVVAGVEHLDLGEDAVQVLARGLGGAGQRRVVERLDAARLGAHAVLDALLAEVGAPRPGGDDDLHRRVHGEQAHLAVAAEDQRADVAGLELVALEHLEGGVVELLDRVRHRHVVELGGPLDPLEVLGETEHGDAALGLVGADALEDPGAVVQRVREHVDLGVGPGDQRAVHPDRVHLGDRGHRLPPRVLSPGREGGEDRVCHLGRWSGSSRRARRCRRCARPARGPSRRPSLRRAPRPAPRS